MTQSAELDLTTLISALNAMSQVLLGNGRYLNTLSMPAKYYNITAAGTYEVQATPGTLVSININTGSTGATATVFDSSTTTALPGTLEVGSLTLGTTTVIPGMVPFGPDERGLILNNGLVVVTTGTANLTVGHF